MDIDILGSVEFDLTEAIKDLISQIKFNRQEIEEIKKRLNALQISNEETPNFSASSSWVSSFSSLKLIYL